MKLGAFSLSLRVNDLNVSKAFYEKLGFTVYHGELEQKWLIMKHDEVVIGLFQDMIEKNVLTFNPGWDNEAKAVDPFDDVRQLQEALRAKGIPIIAEVKPNSEGPGRFVIEDPDGNQIMIDQHR